MEEETHRQNQLYRRSRRKGFSFHIDGSILITNNGRVNDSREATGEELEMWRTIFPDPINTKETLDLTMEEADRTLCGPYIFYLHNQDFCTIREHGFKKFEPNTDRNTLLHGFMGSYYETPLYIKRQIPRGYYVRTPDLINVDKIDEWELESMLEILHA